MSNRINILDDLTINKIAAGEVVERPSSVVKELVENCIDANSTKVIIDIVDGGKKSIRITDNGYGILSSEVDKSFLRHATSKIKKIDDLYDLYSLGFRGEALASISAISKLEMITKSKEEAVGTKVIVEGGKIISKEPVGTNNGTTMIIRDIFFNTPVRQKFLKSTHAETINISDLINKLAIGNPNVQFKYINNRKQMLNTPGDGKLINVIRSIYGKDITENLIDVDFECEYFKMSGYIGNNNAYRSNKNLQHTYINKRFVKSKVILDAIAEAYKSIIPIGKHAVCFLNIKINPSKIDVNIHPTKLEVKFEDEKDLYIELRDYLRRRLLSSNLLGKYEIYEKTSNPTIKSIQNIDKVKESEAPIEVIDISKDLNINSFKSVNEILNENKEDNKSNISINNDKNEHISINDNYNLINEIDNSLKENNNITKSLERSIINKDKIELPTKNITISKLDNKNEFIIDGNIDISKSFSMEDLESLDKIEETDYIDTIFEDKNDEPIESFQEGFFVEDDNKFSLSGYNVVGTIFNTYIVLQKGNSMYLLDQHVAHERVLYEKYMEKFYNHDISMQMLLDPIILELSSVDMLQVEKNLDLFMKFGFEIEIFGNNHIMIRCVPTTFGVPESEKFILQIIDNIDEIKNNYELKGEKFASMACKAAIKANDKIHNIEIDSLINQLSLCTNPFTCPHGRPIIVEITKKEIEKMFKRIM
ncbi:DNA mismatch repair protein mutL [uncultured Clostridium sp.]|nr:DNA mismatch repair protein mutL [uncultured Clostridium sp.]